MCFYTLSYGKCLVFCWQLLPMLPHHAPGPTFPEPLRSLALRFVAQNRKHPIHQSRLMLTITLIHSKTSCIFLSEPQVRLHLQLRNTHGRKLDLPDHIPMLSFAMPGLLGTHMFMNTITESPIPRGTFWNCCCASSRVARTSS